MLGAAMLLPFGSRGYRTAKFTQKMGRKHYKGRGAKSFGYLTTKGASAARAQPRTHLRVARAWLTRDRRTPRSSTARGSPVIGAPLLCFAACQVPSC
jgi:hypothetical protein